MERRYIFLNIGIFLIIILLLLMMILFVNIKVYNYFVSSKNEILAGIEESTGYQIKYKNFYPNITPSIKIYQVTLNKKDNSEKIMIGDVTLHYSILKIITGGGIKSVIKKITINKIYYETNFDNLKRITENFDTKENKPLTRLDLGFDDLQINILNIVMNIKNKNLVTNLNIKSTNLKLKENTIAIQSSLSGSYLDNKKNIYETGLDINGILYNNDNKICSKIYFMINNINLNRTYLREQKLYFVSSGSDFRLSRMVDTLPITLDVSKTENLISIRTTMDNLKKTDIIKNGTDNQLIPEEINLKTSVKVDVAKKDYGGFLEGELFFAKFFSQKNVKIDYDFKFDNSKLTIGKLDIFENGNPENSLKVSGTTASDLSRFDFRVAGSNFKIGTLVLNSEINLTRTGSAINLKSNGLSINNYHFENFWYQANYNNINSFTVKTLSPFNNLLITKENENKISVNFDNFNLNPFIPKSDLKNPIFINTKFNINYNAGKNIIFCEESELNIFNNKNRYSVLFSFFNSNIHLKNPSINNKTYDLKMLADLKNKNCELNGNLHGKIYNGKLYMKKDSIYGNINKSFNFSYLNETGFLYLSFNNFILPVENEQIQLNGDIGINTKYLTMVRSKLTLDNVPGFNAEKGRLNFDIEALNKQIKIENITFNTKKDRFTGNISGSYSTEDGIKVETKGLLLNQDKQESYSLNFKLDKSIVNSKIYITNMEAAKFIKNTSGNLNIRLGVNGEITNPNLTFEGETLNVFVNKKKLNSIFYIKKRGNIITLNKIIIEYNKKNSIFINNSNILLPENNTINKDTFVNINGSMYFEPIAHKIKSDFSIYGTIDKKKDFSMNIDLKKSSIAYVKMGKITGSGEKSDLLAFELKKEGNNYLFNDKEKKTILFKTDTKNYSLSLLDKNNEILNASFNITEKENLNGNLFFKKFPARIFSVLSMPFVKFNDGYLDGNVKLSGTKSVPDFSGELGVYMVNLDIPDYLPQPITNISGKLKANKNKFYVYNVFGSVNRGLVNGKGEIVFAGLKFENFDFKIYSDIVPFHFINGPFNITGNAALEELRITGTGSPPNFNFIGKVNVDKADINISNSTGEHLTPLSIPLNADMTFLFGKKINVNYPLITGKVKENDQIRVEYTGLDNAINLLGIVNLQSGKINYLNKIFKIEEAQFNFDGYEPLNPLVDIVSYWTTKDSEHDSVKIYLNMKERLFSFNTNFTSTPSKSEFEINQMLGMAAANENDESVRVAENTLNSPGIDTLLNTTNYLGNRFLFSQIENNIKKITTLDTFSFNTSAFGNIIQSNKDIMELLDNSSLTIGKYIADGIYLESLMTFNKKNDISSGDFYTFPGSNYGLDLQLMVQFDLPFISLGYSYIPKDIKNLSDAEQKISLETSIKF